MPYFTTNELVLILKRFYIVYIYFENGFTIYIYVKFKKYIDILFHGNISIFRKYVQCPLGENRWDKINHTFERMT